MNIKEILAKHQKWLNGEAGGERANLSWADLSWADLSWANLRGADLSWADLRGADLRGAENTDSVTWNIYTAFYPLQCPERGGVYSVQKSSRLDNRARNTR